MLYLFPSKIRKCVQEKENKEKEQEQRQSLPASPKKRLSQNSEESSSQRFSLSCNGTCEHSQKLLDSGRNLFSSLGSSMFFDETAWKSLFSSEKQEDRDKRVLSIGVGNDQSISSKKILPHILTFNAYGALIDHLNILDSEKTSTDGNSIIMEDQNLLAKSISSSTNSDICCTVFLEEIPAAIHSLIFFVQAYSENEEDNYLEELCNPYIRVGNLFSKKLLFRYSMEMPPPKLSESAQEPPAGLIAFKIERSAQPADEKSLRTSILNCKENGNNLDNFWIFTPILEFTPSFGEGGKDLWKYFHEFNKRNNILSPKKIPNAFYYVPELLLNQAKCKNNNKIDFFLPSHWVPCGVKHNSLDSPLNPHFGETTHFAVDFSAIQDLVSVHCFEFGRYGKLLGHKRFPISENKEKRNSLVNAISENVFLVGGIYGGGGFNQFVKVISLLDLEERGVFNQVWCVRTNQSFKTDELSEKIENSEKADEISNICSHVNSAFDGTKERIVLWNYTDKVPWCILDLISILAGSTNTIGFSFSRKLLSKAENLQNPPKKEEVNEQQSNKFSQQLENISKMRAMHTKKRIISKWYLRRIDNSLDTDDIESQKNIEKIAFKLLKSINVENDAAQSIQHTLKMKSDNDEAGTEADEDVASISSNQTISFIPTINYSPISTKNPPKGTKTLHDLAAIASEAQLSQIGINNFMIAAGYVHSKPQDQEDGSVFWHPRNKSHHIRCEAELYSNFGDFKGVVHQFDNDFPSVFEFFDFHKLYHNDVRGTDEEQIVFSASGLLQNDIKHIALFVDLKSTRNLEENGDQIYVRICDSSTGKEFSRTNLQVKKSILEAISAERKKNKQKASFFRKNSTQKSKFEKQNSSGHAITNMGQKLSHPLPFHALTSSKIAVVPNFIHNENEIDSETDMDTENNQTDSSSSISGSVTPNQNPLSPRRNDNNHETFELVLEKQVSEEFQEIEEEETESESELDSISIPNVKIANPKSNLIEKKLKQDSKNKSNVMSKQLLLAVLHFFPEKQKILFQPVGNFVAHPQPEFVPDSPKKIEVQIFEARVANWSATQNSHEKVFFKMKLVQKQKQKQKQKLKTPVKSVGNLDFSKSFVKKKIFLSNDHQDEEFFLIRAMGDPNTFNRNKGTELANLRISARKALELKNHLHANGMWLDLERISGNLNFQIRIGFKKLDGLLEIEEEDEF